MNPLDTGVPMRGTQRTGRPEKLPLDEDFPTRCRGKGCTNRLPAKVRNITETITNSDGSTYESVIDTVQLRPIYRREFYCHDCLLPAAVAHKMRHLPKAERPTKRGVWKAATDWIFKQNQIKAAHAKRRKEAEAEAA